MKSGKPIGELAQDILARSRQRRDCVADTRNLADRIAALGAK